MITRWDAYFMDVCDMIATNSHCLSRKLGAILIRDHSIIATGYNGPARGTHHCDERIYYDSFLIRELRERNIINPDPRLCPRRIMQYESGQGLHICVATHAEANCIANAARNGVGTSGCTLYLNWVHPCKDCISLIANAGIVEVVCQKGTYDALAQRIGEEAGVSVRYYGE